MTRQLYILFVLSLFTQISFAQINVKASLDSTNILIGDQVKLKLYVKHQPEVKVDNIDFTVLSGASGLEFLGQTKPDTVYNKEEIHFEQSFVLTSFDSGYHKVPAIPVSYSLNGQSDNLMTNDLGLMVRTLVVQDTVSLQPIKDIIREPVGFEDILPYVLGGVFVLLVVFLVLFLLNRKKQAPEPPPLPIDNRPAHIIALEALDVLKNKEMWQKGDIKEYHTELTYILRSYLEKRFTIPALESTTDEIVRFLEVLNEPVLGSDQISAVRTILQNADLIKFAKAEPPVGMHDDMMGLTARTVEETKLIQIVLEEEDNAETESN
ncbi:MAG: hypothetical protein AAFO07_07930 [Bacteroidota bacterium]